MSSILARNTFVSIYELARSSAMLNISLFYFYFGESFFLVLRVDSHIDQGLFCKKVRDRPSI